MTEKAGRHYVFLPGYTIGSDLRKNKGGIKMSSELESNEIKKSMAYDLIKIVEAREGEDPKNYTAKDIIGLIDEYIRTSTSNS